MKLVISLILLFLLIFSISFAQEQSHPLTQIKPIDVSLNMYGFNITNVTYVGINTSFPLYPLHVIGDVYWSGTLRGGVVPWNLLSSYDLNVNWIGKLGWGNLTNYPSIITPIGSGLNVSTQSLSGNIILGVNFTETQKRITGSCSDSKAIQVINADGSVTCVDINLYGNITGSGDVGYIPIWASSSTLGNSLIAQIQGNIWITSGNLNIISGAFQIENINVIDNSRNIINVNWVNATNINATQAIRVSQICIGNDCISEWANLTETDPYWDTNISSIPTNYLIKKGGNGISQSIIYDTETNVGIGTVFPSSKLEVSGGDIEINDGFAIGSYTIKGDRVFYAGDETEVSTTSTTDELKKEFNAVFDSNYGIKPRYVNIIARIKNNNSYITTLNITIEGCNGIILTTNSNNYTIVKGSISTSNCPDGIYPTKIYLKTSDPNAIAYNDIIEFYYVK